MNVGTNGWTSSGRDASTAGKNDKSGGTEGGNGIPLTTARTTTDSSENTFSTDVVGSTGVTEQIQTRTSDMIRRIFLAMVAFVSGCCSCPAFAQEPIKNNIVNPYEDDTPEMKPLTEADVRAIFGSMIDEKLVPMRRTDQQLEERIARVEATLASFGNSKVTSTRKVGGGGSTGSVVASPYVAPKVTTRVMAPPARQWTYPGEIHDHLNRSHGVSGIEGMSTADAEALHSSIHESEGVILGPMVPKDWTASQGQVVSVVTQAPSVQVIQPASFSTSVSKSVSNPLWSATRTATSSSNCPGGVCPAPSARSFAPRARWFGR